MQPKLHYSIAGLIVIEKNDMTLPVQDGDLRSDRGKEYNKPV